MIDWLAAGTAVVVFVVLARALGMVEKSHKVTVVVRHSVEVIRSPRIGDEAKEAALKSNSRQLFTLSLVIVFGCALAMLPSLLLIWFGDRLGMIALSSVTMTATSPGFLIVSSGLAILALGYGQMARMDSANKDYSMTDRLMHHVAFRTGAAQIALADLETRLFDKQLASCVIERPVFITALPRAGTTLLLECCARSSGFATP